MEKVGSGEGKKRLGKTPKTKKKKNKKRGGADGRKWTMGGGGAWFDISLKSAAKEKTEAEQKNKGIW